MPPKKRALSQSDSNVQPPNQPKHQKHGQVANDTENENEGGEASQNEAEPEVAAEQNPVKERTKNLKPNDYVCISRPPWDRGDENDDPESDEEEGDSTSNHAENKAHFLHPASKFPEWKWKITWQAWKKLSDFVVRQKYCDPDLFDMDIYNDFHSYGVIELVENAVVEFNKEYTKRNPDLHALWSSVAMLAHFMQIAIDDIVMADDADRVWQFVALLGCMVLTALHAVDRMGKLTQGSEMVDLALVMSLHLRWSEGQDEVEVIEAEKGWRHQIVAYAKKAGIDLGTEGCALGSGLERFGDVQALGEEEKVDRWGWAKAFKEYKDAHQDDKGKIGGQNFDITKMSSRERKDHHFEGRDPLAHIPKEALKNNQIDLA